ncbi:MAG TPA: FkbM family methyltransferase, partial [Phycisphaerae bacterium]|nr:FkbM family methyltransferase [Phycisphaerae bacterium]
VCEFWYPREEEDNQGLASIVSKPSEGCECKAVETTTLDSFTAERGIKRVDFIKMDVQGAEYKILQGSRSVLSRFAPVLVVEVSPKDLECSGHTSRDLCELIASYGYRLFKLRRNGVGRAIPVNRISADFAATSLVCINSDGKSG